MTQKELKYKLNITRCLRLHGFPFMMPIVNQYNGDWEKAQPLVSLLVHQHVELKHTEILKKLCEYASKQDIKEAFMSIIENDFFKVGYKREQVALNKLKTLYPDILWKGDLEYKWECMGIDIIGTVGDSVYGVSVKGFNFRNAGADYVNHKHKVISHIKLGDLASASIALVDEINSKIEFEDLSKGVA